MTPEQLEEIEKLAEAWRAMSLHRLVAEVMVPMTTALREAWKERDEARATNERLRAALERIANPAAVGSAFHEEAVAIARRAL